MFQVLSEQLENVADQLADTTDLVTLSGVLDVDAFIDVLQHAAVNAMEAEHEAARATALTGVVTHVAYPPLVRLLARSLHQEV